MTGNQSENFKIWYVKSRLSKEECTYHYAEIFESLAKFQDVAEKVKKREEKYRNYDIPMVRPAKK